MIFADQLIVSKPGIGLLLLSVVYTCMLVKIVSIIQLTIQLN